MDLAPTFKDECRNLKKHIAVNQTDVERFNKLFAWVLETFAWVYLAGIYLDEFNECCKFLSCN